MEQSAAEHVQRAGSVTHLRLLPTLAAHGGRLVFDPIQLFGARDKFNCVPWRVFFQSRRRPALETDNFEPRRSELFGENTAQGSDAKQTNIGDWLFQRAVSLKIIFVISMQNAEACPE
jgi:hypothetical protein